MEERTAVYCFIYCKDYFCLMQKCSNRPILIFTSFIVFKKHGSSLNNLKAIYFELPNSFPEVNRNVFCLYIR